MTHLLRLVHKIVSLAEILLDGLYGSKCLGFAKHRLLLAVRCVVSLITNSTGKDATDFIKVASCLLQLLTSLFDTILAVCYLRAWIWVLVLGHICWRAWNHHV